MPETKSKSSGPGAPAFFPGKNSDDVFSNLAELSRLYFPDWATHWEQGHARTPSVDPGIVLLRQGAMLFSYLNRTLNQLPEKYRLGFFEFMGLGLRLPVPASAFLTFTLSEDAAPALLPAKAKISASDDPGLIFSTQQELQVFPAEIKKCFSLNPASDRYFELSNPSSGGSGPFELFRGSSGWRDVPHVLYLTDALLLNIQSPVRSIRIELEGAHLRPEFFSHWSDGNGNFIASRVLETSFSRILLELTDVQKIERSVVYGSAGQWLRVQPEAGVRVVASDQSQLPRLSSVEAVAVAEGIVPDAGFYNQNSLELKNGFLPFGETPAVGDAFYLKSDEVFLKWGADVTLNVLVLKQLQKPFVELAWEHWDGQQWASFWVEDSTDHFSRNGRIQFVCPPVQPTTINGEHGRWIRARIAGGGYGHPGEYVVTTPVAEAINTLQGLSDMLKENIVQQLEKEGYSFGYKIDPPIYHPPEIQSIDIAYSFAGSLLSNAIAYNNFSYSYFRPNGAPFKPFPTDKPALFIGLSPASFGINATGRVFTLFFSIENHSVQTADSNQESAGFVWSYSSGSTWQPLKITDGTRGFSQSGVVQFLIPDIQPAAPFDFQEAGDASVVLDGESEDESQAPGNPETALLWIRVELDSCCVKTPPLIAGIFPNTVLARNEIEVENEILGSSGGQPNLELRISETPVLKEVRIEALEPILLLGAGGEGANLQVSSAGEAERQWVEWSEVESFALSNSSSRHYILDHLSGKVLFGNGVEGMIPPEGADNIRARLYFAGGGIRGNVPAQTLTRLMSDHPDILAVSNPQPAWGGADGDDILAFSQLAPGLLQSDNRAVVEQDFAVLARESSPIVRRSSVATDGVGQVVVRILADNYTDSRAADEELLARTQRFLRRRSLFLAADQVIVKDPVFVPVAVFLKINLDPAFDRQTVFQSIRHALADYWRPLSGNNSGEGWEFGATVYASRLVDYLESRRISGLQRVISAALNGPSAVFVKLGAAELPSEGISEMEVV